jgi:anti-anti-sigma factor
MITEKIELLAVCDLVAGGPARTDGIAGVRGGAAPIRLGARVMSELLSIARIDDDRGVVLALAGELDVISAPELEMHLNGLAAEACPRVLLDLGSLTFVDSAGVSVLVKAKHEAEAGGRRLILRSATEQVHSVFSVVGLADWLAYEDS